MNAKQIKIWYWVFIAELLFAGAFLLILSFFTKPLGIDSNENWDIRRIVIATLGMMLGCASVLLLFPFVKKVAQTHRPAERIRYLTESTTWILVALVFCELLLQQTVMRFPKLTQEKNWGVVPISGSTRFLGKEGYGITHYMEHGEIATPFDDGNISIVVLGDSHAEALQVSDDIKFASVAETYIRSKDKFVNLHNLGKSANNIPDYIYYAPLIKQYYTPEIVVVQLTSSDGPDGFISGNPNYFAVNDAGNLEIRRNDQHVAGTYNKLYNDLRIMLPYLGRDRYFEITEGLYGKRNASKPLQSVTAIDVEARMVEQLTLLKEAYSGIKVVLFLLPSSPDIDGNSIRFEDPEYQALLESAEKSNGFFVIDAKPEFDRLVEQNYLPRGFMNSLPGIGHLNILGNRVIGELLAENLLEILH